MRISLFLLDLLIVGDPIGWQGPAGREHGVASVITARTAHAALYLAPI